MGNIPLHAKAVPRLDVGAQTSNSSISDPGLFSPRDVELTALPPQAAPREHPPQTGNVVGIFWDYENVRVPGKKTGAAGAVDAIRRLALEHGTVAEQRLYYDSRHETEQYTDRINLDMSGFTLVDCPKRNKRAARAGARPPPSTLPHRDAAAPQKRDATAPHPRVSIQ